MSTPKLIACPVCGGKVSSDAPACIHCGHPMKEREPDISKKKIDQNVCKLRMVSEDPKTTRIEILTERGWGDTIWAGPNNSVATLNFTGSMEVSFYAKLGFMSGTRISEPNTLYAGHNYEVRFHKVGRMKWGFTVSEIDMII